MNNLVVVEHSQPVVDLARDFPDGVLSEVSALLLVRVNHIE